MRRVLNAVLPGYALHELAHVWAAQAVGARAKVDWQESSVMIQWPTPRTARDVYLVHWAPMILGWALGLLGLVLVIAMPGLVSEIPKLLLFYVLANFVALSLPSKSDLFPSVRH